MALRKLCLWDVGANDGRPCPSRDNSATAVAGRRPQSVDSSQLGRLEARGMRSEFARLASVCAPRSEPLGDMGRRGRHTPTLPELRRATLRA
eukprot:2904201-Prymnesium_polylepis.1